MVLAVDLGVKTGLALFSKNGQLCWVRSGNFGSAARLKKAIPAILAPLANDGILVLEGGGDLKNSWSNAAKLQRITVVALQASDWRNDLFYSRDQRTGKQAKIHALKMAHNLIRESGIAAPKSLTDDAAEAFLIGYWFLNYYLV
ncbi:MAG: hypothetical protein EOL88_00175 [Bacteroidia bacterium]|nr:hypothetical protein [Bacteroidia bacterium]